MNAASEIGTGTRESAQETARERLKDALCGRASSGVEVVRGVRPSMLDADAARALSAPLLAGFMVAAAMLRAQIARTPLDLLTLLLHTAAFAFCLRALILLAVFALRVRKDMQASGHALSFSREGVLWQSPEGERFVSREDLVALAVPNVRSSRLLPQPRRPLLLIMRPQTGSRHWSLPPYFSASSEILAARLTRALGLLDPGPDGAVPPPPAQPASERYTRAAQGRAGAEDAVIPEGHGYRLRGPYGVLLGVVFALDALMSAGAQRALLLQPVLLSCVLALVMPLAWLWFMGRKAKARLGIALLLTPEELIVRGKHGVVSVPYAQISEVEVRLKDIWSPFVGTHTTRSLIITTQDAATMIFDGGFLGVPPEVVAELCSAYRRGRISAPQAAS